MQTAELISSLGYERSSNFLGVRQLNELPEYAYVFRRAVKTCSLKGVFVLRNTGDRPRGAAVPVVYVAEADSPEEADRLHRRVWNQNVVPFLLVRTPAGVRLYSGFDYEIPTPRTADSEQRGVLEAVVAFNEIHDRLSEFCAKAVDDGSLWRARGNQIDPRRRVDWRLLGNLDRLGVQLRKDLDANIAHALIGKFVYLRYLRDREILSDRRLEDWGIDLGRVFGRNATSKEVRRLVEEVDDWLNGSVFPLPFSGRKAPRVEHIRTVASVFLGDEPDTGQLHLDFKAYDFAHIPIETLSVIYEQFLAVEGKNRESGAYYTPIPLVNFMLAELDSERPLRNGMRVLDPSCGSGAFLVQCFRRLIERESRRRRGQRLRPAELRDLLVRQIFGVDRDSNACRVAELSLILTMLDYIEPPDLQSTPTFRLPVLSGQNIFEGDFFDEEASWYQRLEREDFDWIVGNPPWVDASPKAGATSVEPALRWMRGHQRDRPTTGNQVAEAFAWKAAGHVGPKGLVALLMPAMSLFKKQRGFRQRFFTLMDVGLVANFTNLKEVLFAGRARLPAAAIIYSPEQRSGKTPRRSVAVFSPMVVNQEANRAGKPGARRETWSITVNGSELRDLDAASVADGSNLPWKLAMWGAARDKSLIQRVTKRFPSFGSFANANRLKVYQGLELRLGTGVSIEPLDRIPEVAGKYELDTEVLRRLGQVYAFPSEALKLVPQERAFVRKGRGAKALEVCEPPHIIVNAARKFAVFSDTFLVVPPRQIGVGGTSRQARLLRACAAFLGSSFVKYHQFFTSSQAGIVKGVSTLAAFREIPTPLGEIDESEIQRLADLQRLLAAESIEMWKSSGDGQQQASSSEPSERLEALEQEVEAAVFRALGLNERERCLITDLVDTRMRLIDGQVDAESIRAPTHAEILDYLSILQTELNDYLEPNIGLSHRVSVVHDNLSGMIQIELARDGGKNCVMHADAPTASELNRMRVRLLREHEQWLYFDRNLFVHRNNRSYIFKPMERLWWLRSQALLDADEVVATVLSAGDS